MTLGYLIEEEDHAFLESTSTPVLFTSGKLPSKVNYLDKGMFIENQFGLGSCGGNAGSSIAELLNYMDTGDWLQFSRMFCYIMAQREDGINGRDGGCTITGIAKALKSKGICLESMMPYPCKCTSPPRDPRLHRCYSDRVPAEAIAEAANHTIKTWTMLPTVDRARQFAGSGLGGIVIGIYWYEGFDGGVVSSETARGRIKGGHALALPDYDDSDDCMWGPNSWGKQFGQFQGRFKITYEYYDKIMNNGRSFAVGMSDLEEFRQPRDFGGMA